MRLTWIIVCLAALVLTTVKCRRFGGFGGRSGSRTSSWSRPSSSSFGSSSRTSWSPSSTNTGFGSSSGSSWSSRSSSFGQGISSRPSWASRPSSSGYGSSSGFSSNSQHSSSNFGSSRTQQGYGWTGLNSGKVTLTKPSTNQHSSSHVIPLSSGSRTNGVHGSNPAVPSAPPLPTSGLNKQHVPNQQTSNTGSAATLAGSSNPPSPGWHPSVTQDVSKKNVPGLNNPYPGQSPPPYPGHPPNAPPVPNHPPPPYPGMNPGTNHPYPNYPPPPYPGTNHPYPNQPPPPYPGTNHPYPNHPPPAYGSHYYPAPPPPPPGFSPYGVPYYKERSRIGGSDVIAGLALWELMRDRHHHYGVQQVHHHHYNDNNYDGATYYQPTYHDTMRERYTTRITPNTNGSPKGPGAYNILEMTHYITPNDEGVISSTQGNMTCVSVYNAKSVTSWHQKQVDEFHKQYPNSVFPLYQNENNTKTENFTVIPGRLMYREPISITCCGTDKTKLDLNLLTNGKHPDVNCVNHLGHIPIKKLTFVRVEEKVLTTNTTGWHEINLINPNVTGSIPLAPLPSNSSNNVTLPTPLIPFSTNLSSTSTESSVPPSGQFFTSLLKQMEDRNQTFDSLGAKNKSGSVDLTEASENGTTEGIEVTTTFSYKQD